MNAPHWEIERGYGETKITVDGDAFFFHDERLGGDEGASLLLAALTPRAERRWGAGGDAVAAEIAPRILEDWRARDGGTIPAPEEMDLSLDC